MTDTGRQSSLTSFFFGKQKERDDGNKENQPELADKRQKMDSPAKHKQRIRHESEGKYEQDFKWPMAHCHSRRILLFHLSKYQELLPNVSKLASIAAVIPVSTIVKKYGS
jgi:hypothetical protein